MATGSSGLTYWHLVDISRRITSADEYQSLSVKVLRLPGHQVDSIWTKHQPDTNQAAFDALKTWFKQQPDGHEALSNLHAALQRCKMNQLAIYLVQCTAGANEVIHLSQESK